MIRTLMLVLSFGAAFIWMRDVGFSPASDKRLPGEARRILRAAIEHGLANPPVRWIMFDAPFAGAVTLYAFYAMQPYLLELYGDDRAYAVAGLAAAIVAGAQIAGGLLVPYVGRLFHRRTTVLLTGTTFSVVMLATIGFVPRFPIVIVLLVLWGLLFAAMMPVRHAYLNALIDSRSRATVLSFDSLMGSGGAAVGQPILGRVADLSGYPASYVWSAGIQALSLPFIWLARHRRAAADRL
jgi:MFS family permease